MPKRWAIYSWRNKPIHPDIEWLLEYRDGKLDPVVRKIVAAHLRSCEECRMESVRLDYALDCRVPPVPEKTTLADTEILGRLMANVAAWRASGSEPCFQTRAVTERVASELGIYLGERGANRVMCSVWTSGENLLSTVEPVLALFVGTRAAAVLVSRIVDSAIVRHY